MSVRHAIGFSNKTAIVTGAGLGLGRAYAIALASRGARVVVNDLGCARDGRGVGHPEAAAAVVREIRRSGGMAFADHGDVTKSEQMDALVARTEAEWGAIDILINNAGIIRGGTFAEMSGEDFRSAFEVKLLGAVNATRAVWKRMISQRYGRILMTSSGIGLYGEPGHANYAAGKSGILGLAKSLHLEGEPFGVRVNTLAPAAATRMTDDVMPPATVAIFGIEHVVPAALFLVSDAAPSNLILGAGAGCYNAAYVTMTRGVSLPLEQQTPEGIADSLARILDRSGETTPVSCFDQVSQFAGMQVSPSDRADS